MKYIVYIIYSGSLDKFYVGFTSRDITDRLSKHNSNHRGFNGKHADWIIKLTEFFTSKSAAMLREREIKGWKSRAKIQKLFLNE